MSLMKMLNKMGRRIDPCGTPNTILHHSPKLFSVYPLKLFRQIALNKFYYTDKNP